MAADRLIVVRRLLALLLPVLVLAAGLMAYAAIRANPPALDTRAPPRSRPVPVQASRLVARDYRVELRSFGTVAARQRTQLVAQVGGVVTRVADNFRVGAAVAAGEVLLELESADHRIAVRGAEAALVQARATLTEERARGEAAAADWQKLGKRGEPGPLVLRAPQQQAARAQVQAAQAQLERAQLDLERTRIRAPYGARVLARAVDEGRYVTPGTALGELYAAGTYDVRLPLSAVQFEQLSAAELAAGDTPVRLLVGDPAAREVAARLVRSEGQIDPRTRQLFVVAEVLGDGDLTLGQFVEARLPGRRYRDVFVIPDRLLRPSGEVLIAVDGRVRRVPVQLHHSDGEEAVVTGLRDDQVLILTPLGDAASGLRVAATVDAEAPLSAAERAIGGRAEGGSGHPPARAAQRRP